MKKNILTITALCSLIAIAGCGKKQEAAEVSQKFPVQVQPAERRMMEERVDLVGSIKAKDEALLYPRVSGKLLDNLVREGGKVKKNQTVALIQRDEVGASYEPAPVPSTLNGVVGRIYLDRGANVTPATPIALVVDPDKMLVQVEVPERYAGQIVPGLSVRLKVDAYPAALFNGKVSLVSPVLDKNTRTLHIEADLENQGGALKSGMFANVSIILQARAGAVAVPVNSLIEGNSWYIFVAVNGKAVKRQVGIGIRNDQFAEIRTGLSEGEPVITSGVFDLQDGSPVEIVK